MNLTHLQSLLSIRLEQAFEEDVFVGMLNSTITNNMAYGLASAVDFGRLQGTFDAFNKENSPELMDLFLTNLSIRSAAEVWNTIPMANMLTEDFRDHTLALVAAVALELFTEYREMRGANYADHIMD